MSNPFEITITLKQHTPLIHFQHEQDRATLRATEVKPKLDRFLIKNHRHSVQEFIKTTPNGHEFLDYKIFIEAPQGDIFYMSLPNGLDNTDGVNYFEKKISSYFGNTGIQTKKEARCAVYTTQDIKLYVRSFNIELKTLIETQFPYFIAVTNFGTRQNKGFGSFFIKDKPIASINNPCRYFTIETSDYVKALNDINLFYRCLRSGINQKTSTRKDEAGKNIIEDAYYFKSLMFMYAKSKKFTWDKRTMRETFYLSNRTYQQVKTNRTDPNGTVNWQGSNDQHYLFRDLLGLSSEQEWQSYDKDKITKSDIQKEPNGKDVIERFKSPITFKPIIEGNQFRVLIILDEIPDAYKQSTFKVNSRVGGHENYPIYPDFDLTAFFDFCIGLDIDNHFVEKNVSNPTHQAEIATIKTIFRQLKSQMKL